MYLNKITLKSRYLLKSYKRLTSISARNCNLPKNVRVENLMEIWENTFKKNKIPEPEYSIRLILAEVLNCTNLEKVDLLHSQELSEEQITQLNRYCECRLARMPIQYVVKRWEFRNIKLELVPPVFIPRPETEALIDIVLKNTLNLQSVLEIGCGSGAISISLLKENKKLKITAIDRNKAACELTLSNAKLNEVDDRLTVIHKKLTDDGNIDNFEANFDTIVSNPPYLFTSELSRLEPELLYEDVTALNGGVDGLRVIKAILKYASNKLKPSQHCYFEIHHEHVPLITEWLKENENLNLELIEIYHDFVGKQRFVRITKI